MPSQTVRSSRSLYWCLVATLLTGPVTSATPATDARTPGARLRDCPDICPEMVVIPPGSFLMGSPPSDPNHQSEEQPQHQVDIAYRFAIGRFEVTRDEYAAFVKDTGLADPGGCNVHEPPRWPTIMGLNWHNTGFPQSGRDPVVCVSWEEAKTYAAWLSRKTGHTYRLPSESEWEYADRAGTDSPAYWGNDPDEACQYANGVDATLTERFGKGKWDDRVPCHDGFVFTAPVGSFKPNTFGLYDMEGNAFEWVEDCLSEDYQGVPTDGSARTAGADCSSRMNRGGSWTSMPTGLRAAHRGADHFKTTRVVDLGFRIARTIP